MADFDKENIADGPSVASPHKRTAPSPRKGAKKTRSLSMGPGALSVPLKEDSGNRRKSAFPSVKSILPSKEDEEKRRAARRKSLANRRVSFAPEATLHTWDVIEYMRDATTSSSASSEATRTASAIAQKSAAQSAAVDAEPPSTPPEQVEEPLPESSPASQRDLHQRKFRRRSSGIPPLNFGNPDDVESSSPVSGSSPASSESEIVVDGADDEDDEDEDEEDTAMSLDGEVTGTVQSLASIGSSDGQDSTSSSGRLDEALRRAVAQAKAQDTQHIGYDDMGDKSMDITNVEIANAFKPWIQKGRNLSSLQDQENVNPFSPAFKAHTSPSRSAKDGQDEFDEDTQDMSMDMTHVIGGIVKQQKSAGSANETTPTQQKGLKRRRSSTNVALARNSTSVGSPATRQSSRRSSVRRRRSSAEESELGDETMDFTMAIGGIQQAQSQDTNRRESVDTSLGDETMEFTMVQGGILGATRMDELDELNVDEDLSMELTATLEKTIKVQPIQLVASSSARATRSPRKGLISVSTPEKQSKSPARQPKTPTPQKSPRRTPRKSLGPSALRNELARAMEAEPEPEPVTQTSNESTGTIQDAAQPTPPKFEIPETNIQESEAPAVLVAATPPQQKAPTLAEVFAASPLKPSVLKPSLADSIKLLSTPRKQAQTSPVKRAGSSTPKVQATPKKTATPKKAVTPKRSTTPRKRGGRVGFAIEEQENEPVTTEDDEDHGSEQEVERIQLQDFLNMTNIRFMDLTTTKRRHTGFPSAEGKPAPEYDGEDESPPSLESSVAAAACTVPMLTMYQHSCHEMKNYIAGGRDDLRTLEAEVYESQPPLFQEYMSAPPDERAIMDNQFKNMKTNARLQSKAGWHAWRSQLLTDLKAGLLQSAADFDEDSAQLSRQEELLNATLPDLVSYNEELDVRCKQLQERADELSSDNLDELEAARERLMATDATIEERKRLVAELQAELSEKEARVEAVSERKAECLEEIKEAERVREEYRGWSANEVSILKAKVDALEHEYGWAVSSASSSPDTITLTYKSDLELFFHPSSFQNATTETEMEAANAPIRLSYIGDDSRSSNINPRVLTTTKRFFLQLLRAHLHSIQQSQTPISTLLSSISSGWNTALSITEAVRHLSLTSLTTESILSDERMAVDTMILLPTLQTKVNARFEIAATVVGEEVETFVKVEARVVYGERYDESKMGEFLAQFAGGKVGRFEDMGKWADGMEDLRVRLIRRGRKN